MKQTPDKETLRLDHVKTGESGAFEFRVQKVTPWLMHMVDERDQLSQKVSSHYKAFQEARKDDPEHKMPKEYLEDVRKLKQVKNEILTLLIQPKGGFKTSDELSEILPFIESDIVVEALIELFFSLYPNTSGSAKEYQQQLRDTKAKIRQTTNS